MKQRTRHEILSTFLCSQFKLAPITLVSNYYFFQNIFSWRILFLEYSASEREKEAEKEKGNDFTISCLIKCILGYLFFLFCFCFLHFFVLAFNYLPSSNFSFFINQKSCIDVLILFLLSLEVAVYWLFNRFTSRREFHRLDTN